MLWRMVTAIDCMYKIGKGSDDIKENFFENIEFLIVYDDLIFLRNRVF